ncbi:MAG: septum site-determining protein MinD, partial [Clostridia bacterium]|nr:septum site-determining protein MinD [Clostridia bacterium]
AIVVVTPSIASVRDADKVIGILKSYDLSSIKLIVNKIRGDLVISNEMYSAEEIEATLKIPLLGIIPDDDELMRGLIEIPNEAEKSFKIIANNLNGKTEKVYDYLKKYSGFWGSIRRELRKRI